VEQAVEVGQQPVAQFNGRAGVAFDLWAKAPGLLVLAAALVHVIVGAGQRHHRAELQPAQVKLAGGAGVEAADVRAHEGHA